MKITSAHAPEIRVSNWGELQDALFLNSWRSDIARYRSRNVFRGLSCVNYELRTTLQRLGGEYWALEKNILRNFQKYAHRDVVERDTLWHWLSVAQHHGLPTRLLDWTNSPFVALHFVTCNLDRFDDDGVVWAADIYSAYEMLPEDIRKHMGNTKAFTVGELVELFSTLEHFDQFYKEPFLIYFEPPSIDERIVNQWALFSVMSSSRAYTDDWLARDPSLCRKIIIPASLKPEIRDRLDDINVTERVYFPGLDGLSKWLTRFYGPSMHERGENPSVKCRGKYLQYCTNKSGWEFVRQMGAKRQKVTESMGGEEYPTAVMVLGVLKNNSLLFVEQFRWAINKRVIELPAGHMSHEDAEVKDTAIREMKEETGYKANEVVCLAAGTVAQDIYDEVLWVCLCKNIDESEFVEKERVGNSQVMVHKVTQGIIEEGEETIVYEVPIAIVFEWLAEQRKRNKMIDLKIYACLALAKDYFVELQ